jgi:predicted patatin/cPLA2 family phospholipase
LVQLGLLVEGGGMKGIDESGFLDLFLRKALNLTTVYFSKN